MFFFRITKVLIIKAFHMFYAPTPYLQCRINLNIGTIYLYSFTDHREPRIFAFYRPFTFHIDNLTAMLLVGWFLLALFPRTAGPIFQLYYLQAE